MGRSALTTRRRGIRMTAFHVLPDSPQMQKDFLQMLVSLESHSQHPVASDILRVGRVNGIAPVAVSGFQEFPGQGLGGLIQLPSEPRPRAMLVGSRSFLSDSGLDIPAMLEVTARRWESEPGSFIALGGWDGWVRGVIQFSRPDVSISTR